MGVTLRQTATNTVYIGRLSANTNTILIGKIVSGTETDLFSAAFTTSINTYYWIRFRIVGSHLYLRCWADGSGEPTTWNVTGTDTSITTTGGFGITINASSSAVTWDFDNYAVTDATSTKVVGARVRLAATNNKYAGARVRLRAQVSLNHNVRTILGTGGGTSHKNFGTRLRLRALRTKMLQARFILGNVISSKNLNIRTLLSSLNSQNVGARVRLRQTVSYTSQIRVILSPVRGLSTGVRLLLASASISSGGFTVFANGASGSVKVDQLRVAEYPDPALVLGVITPRVGATSILWNDIIPTSTSVGIDISFDGVNWTDVTSQNGGQIPTIFSQPIPTTDQFTSDTSLNYTSTFRTGGSLGTWTYDTTNSRVIATGGSNALFLYSSISKADIFFFADLDRSDAGGLVWRYTSQSNFYYLLIGDTLASYGSANTVTLFKVASNVQTQLATAVISYTNGPSTVKFVRGTYRRFAVTMLAGVITVTVDGVQLISFTDGSPLSAGLMGLYNNSGATGSRYYQLWITPQGDVVTGTPSGDIVTGKFLYTRARLATTDPTTSPQLLSLTTSAFNPNIGVGITIPAITYATTFVGSNIDDLAKQSNYHWYIDQNKNPIFSTGFNIPAPWIAQSDFAKLTGFSDIEVNGDFELDVANDLYRNRQTILGAVGTSSFTETKTGDGSTRTFTLGYPLADTPSITLNGFADTSIGLKGTTGFNYYYALNDPIIVQDASRIVLRSTDQLVVSYTGFFDVTVTVDNVSEQAVHAVITGGTGIVEAVEDHTGQNLSQSAATTLATQLLTRYATSGRTLVFDTSRTGLQVGQMLSIFLPEHGVFDGQFAINQIEITLQKGIGDTQVWWFKVTCSELPKVASFATLIASGLLLN